jgi:hypothetical protein
MENHMPARVRIRVFLKKLLPRSLFSVVSTTWRYLGARFIDVHGIVEKYTADFLTNHPKVVQGGPFKGMQYVDSAVGSNYVHKLIGSYEAVLHPYIQKLRPGSFDTVVDIGSAEGYYLIGLGRLFPDVRLVGFEMETDGRNLTQEMFVKNNLRNNLELYGEATADNIAPVLTPKTLLICDCEGAELDILDPEKCPQLLSVQSAIIELRDEFRPGIKEALIDRFTKTHRITILPFKMASPEDYPYLASIQNKNEQYELLRERGIQDQEWMILEKITS